MIPTDPKPGAYAIRSVPEDFIVIEEPLYLPSGEGGHTFLLVEKRGRTTEDVADDLARASRVSARDVGYAGRKDRHALTTQWFSIPELAPEAALEFELSDATVLEAKRHDHKLKTGQLRENRFDITLRRVVGSDVGAEPAADTNALADAEFEAVTERASEILRRGMPNRYGDQRFGRGGGNVARARKILESRSAPRDRRAGRFLISAFQSAVFNAVLDERGDEYDRVALGDLARVEESGGLFWVDDLEREMPRAQAFEISATGPIFGTRMRAPVGEVASFERAVFDQFGLPELAELSLPRGIRARGGRRPLRVRPADLEVIRLEGGGGLRLKCGLPSGAYVTVLLESLVGPVVDGSRPNRPIGDVAEDMA